MNFQQVFVENPEESAKKWSDYSEFKTWIHNKWNREKKVKNKLSIIFDEDKRCFSCNDFSGEKDNTCFIKKGTPKKQIPILKPISIDITESFNKLPEVSPDHQYLNRKGINPAELGLKQITKYKQNWVVVPVYSKDNEIISWQEIGEIPGEKKYLLKDHPISGNYPHFPIGEVKGNFVFLCEGLATGFAINHIVQSKVYTTFGREHLDSVASWLLQKYKEKTIVMCLDFDVSKTSGKETTHTPKISDKRLIFLKPNQPGDFDDFKGNSQERYKLQNPETYHLLERLDTKIKETSYVDIAGQLMRGYVGILCGEKGAMKSKGILSYLRVNKIKTGYFSAGEITRSQANAIDKAHIEAEHTGITGNEQMYIHWLDFNNKETLKNIDKIIQQHKIEIIVEDPPLLNKEMGTQEGLQKYITSRAKIAERHNIAWVCTKNFAKKEYKNILNKVSGYALWTSIPRWLTGVWPIEYGHELNSPKTERDKYTGEPTTIKPTPKSLFQQVVNNVTNLPAQSLLLSFKEVALRQQGVIGVVDVGVTEISKIDRVKNPDVWVKAPDVRQKDKFDTDIWRIMTFIDESKETGIKSKELEKKICAKEPLNWSRAKAFRVLGDLKKQGFITGGGQDKKAPYKLRTKGIEYINYQV